MGSGRSLPERGSWANPLQRRPTQARVLWPNRDRTWADDPPASRSTQPL